MAFDNNTLQNPQADTFEQRQKILIVDDLEQNLFAMSKIVKQLDVDAITASSANEGLSLLLHHKISIAIIDVQMPGMDGFEMARLMQELDDTKNIPIIFKTAINKEQQYVYKGYLAGAVDYLFVPIDPDILVCKLKIFLNIERRNQQLQIALDSLNRINNQYQKVLDSVSDGILGLSAKGIISFANPASGNLLACNSSQLIGKHFISLMNPPGQIDANDIWKLSPLRKLFKKEHAIRFLDGQFWRMDGTSFPVEYSCSAMRMEHANEAGHVLVFQDVTERKIAEEQLMRLANFDSLTGCCNRSSFMRLMRQSISRAKRKNEKFAVLFFDLDKFKSINDVYGHTFGDKLLKSVTDRIQNIIREEDNLARYGGDEFVIMLGDIREIDDAYTIAKKIHNSFSSPFIIDNQEIFSNTSIGLSIYPDDADSPEELIKTADIAMYEAKDSEIHKTFHYTKSMEEQLTESVRTQNALTTALQNQEFNLLFQTYYNIESFKPAGIEALLRWENPDFSHVNTEHCISMLEESGLIVDVGKWVLTQSCYRLKEWQDLNIISPGFKLSVNLSLRQLKEKDFLATVNEVVRETGIDPRMLQLEITESVVMDDPYHVIRLSNDLNNIGVSVAIDDFGTGYSSLAYLSRLHINSLKIDKYFIQQVDKDNNASKIISATINLAHSMNQTVIAEGVEVQEQLDFLQQHRCDLVQGYYFAKPEPVDQVKSRLMKSKHDPTS